MIGFRQVDARYPFLWEGVAQTPGRWHAEGEGPAHYFADTPDGAWAELLRHEEITDPEDLATIRRQMWVVDIGDAPSTRVQLPGAVLTGGLDTYAACQREAQRLREQGALRLAAPSAALKAGGARGYIVDAGVRQGPAQDGTVVVVFGAPAGMVGWPAADDGRPPVDLLDRVRHYTSS
jgi:hypothetical protein